MPPRLTTFVRIPPQAYQMRRMKSPGLHAAAGVLAVICGGLMAFDFGLDYGSVASHDPNAVKAAVVLSIAAAVIGGVMAITRTTVGPPIAAGGAAYAAAALIPLIVRRIDFSNAFNTSHAKFELAAAVVGVVAVVLCLACLDDKANAGIGAAVALLAFVPAVAYAFLIHIDEIHTKQEIAGIAGYVIVGLVILVGGLKGRFGILASMVAAGVQLLLFIETWRRVHDRRAASLAALIACAAIVVLGLVALILAVVGDRADAASAAITQDGPMPGQLTDFVAPVAPNMAAYTMPATPTVAAVVPANIDPAAPAAGTAVMPQWAKDPYGRFQVRYWNGKRWTEHVSTNGVTALDPV